jgi:hypothetical protein
MGSFLHFLTSATARGVGSFRQFSISATVPEMASFLHFSCLRRDDANAQR